MLDNSCASPWMLRPRSHPPTATDPEDRTLHISKTLRQVLSFNYPFTICRPERFMSPPVVNPNLWLLQNKRNWKGRDKPLLSDRNQQLVVDGEQLLQDSEEPKDQFSATAGASFGWGVASCRCQRSVGPCTPCSAQVTVPCILYCLALLSQDEFMNITYEKEQKSQTWHVILNLSPPLHSRKCTDA